MNLHYDSKNSLSRLHSARCVTLGSPCTICKKKIWHFVVMCRLQTLNRLTIKNKYSLPRIDYLFDQGELMYFQKFIYDQDTTRYGLRKKIFARQLFKPAMANMISWYFPLGSLMPLQHSWVWWMVDLNLIYKNLCWFLLMISLF